MWQSIGLPESDATSSSLDLMSNMRRKRYERLPVDPDDHEFNLPDLKVAGLGQHSNSGVGPRNQQPNDNVPSPSILGKVRDAYVNMMQKTAETASATSLVPVVTKKLDRSLTLGGGFGKKVEGLPAKPNLGFQLTKSEKEYIKYLQKTFDGRYA